MILHELGINFKYIQLHYRIFILISIFEGQCFSSVLTSIDLRVCEWWFPNGGSSSVRRSNFPTPFEPQFNALFTSF